MSRKVLHTTTQTLTPAHVQQSSNGGIVTVATPCRISLALSRVSGRRSRSGVSPIGESARSLEMVTVTAQHGTRGYCGGPVRPCARNAQRACI